MDDINKLLDKYLEGETSLEEERYLRHYFRQVENVAEEHKVYASMFNFFSEEIKETVEETKKRRIPLYIWVGIAASFLLIVVAHSFFSTIENDTTNKSLVYIDGKKITDVRKINSEALISIQNISDIDEDVMTSQIGILDSFIE